MKFAVRFGLPLFILVAGFAALTYIFAQPTPDKPYQFKLDPEVTEQAAATSIEPEFNAIDGDRFAYEVYINNVRKGTSHEGGKPVDEFRRTENWVDLVTLIAGEDVLDGHGDLQLRLQYNQIQFLLDNGKARYAGYIGPDHGKVKANFKEVMPDGTRNGVTNIPGWPGVTAGAINSAITAQARDLSASAWFSVGDTGRLYNELYYADFGTATQANYPARFQDALHLALGIQPEFPKGAKLKLGETCTVRRRMPVGLVAGATTEYDVTFKLEKLYGTVEKPTAARFSFTAVPVQREHKTTLSGLDASYTAPDFKNGGLLLDLTKGVAAWTHYEYELKGKVTQPGTDMSTDFDVTTDFTASLRDLKE